MEPQELLQRIKNNKAPAILDVRTGGEFSSGHIPGAINAPFLKILFQRVQLPADKNAELVVTCELGPRAQLAKGLLGMLGYRKISLLEGHMAAWRNAGRPQMR